MRCLLLSCVVLLAGCQSTETPLAATPSAPAASSPSPAPSPPTSAREVDGWLGQWIGPEGTSLTVSRTGDGYGLRIQSLDGVASYQGVALAGQIAFQRKGQTEHLRATDGAGTGMKWLADKRDCLVIRPGEGFCREDSVAEEADSCGRQSYAWLLGEDRKRAPAAPEGKVIRVVCSTCPMTMDYNAERINVIYDDKSGRITTLRCG